MTLRAGIVIAMLVLVGAATFGISVAVEMIVDRAAWADMRSDLERATTIVSETWAARVEVEIARAHMVADEPRLRAIVATSDISHATVVGVVSDVVTRLGPDMFLLTDASGILLGDPEHPEDAGADVRSISLLARALDEGASVSGVVSDDERVFRALAQPIAFGERVVGAIVLGELVDDVMARTLARQTGTEVCFVFGDRIVASSRTGLPSADLASVGTSIDRITLGGTEWLATAIVVADGGSAPLRAVLLRSVDGALAPSRSLGRLVVLVGLIAFLGAALIAFGASRALTRPIDGMVGFARRIATGDLAARAPTSGPLEVRALGAALDQMVSDLAASRTALVEQNRMEKELEIASRLQTSLLPRRPSAAGLAIAARMDPATEVGGDYYDVLPAPGGAWIAIGDVAGHGLRAGVVMLMVRTALAALVSASFDAMPSHVVARLNALVYESVHQRLGTGEHVTFCLLRHFGEGRFVYAGAHEDLLVWRKATGRCERIATTGSWLGVSADIGTTTEDRELVLGEGDVLLLMSDGLFEQNGIDGRVLGPDAVVDVVEAMPELAHLPVESIVDGVITRVGAQAPEPRRDDLTLVVIRRTDAPSNR